MFMNGQDKTYFESDLREIGDRPAAVTGSGDSHRSAVGDMQALASIRLRIKVEKKQPVSEGGLTLTIVLVNEGQADITASNPLDSLQILLKDEEGWPVKMPTGGPPRALINTRGDAPVDIVRSFKVEAIESSRNEPSLLERVMDEKFLFRQGTTYEFRVGVPIVQDSDKRSITIATTKTKQIEKGKYKLKALFQLLRANDSPVNRQFESEEIDIELI
ncbi:MAG TPA: hypothetical protein VFZ52_14075 [Chryseolinea sp.]